MKLKVLLIAWSVTRLQKCMHFYDLKVQGSLKVHSIMSEALIERKYKQTVCKYELVQVKTQV